jgi:DNA-binding NtrC family response regulator
MKTTALLVIEVKHAEIPSFALDLQKKGFDVHIAQNGSKAVALLKEVSPSLVVVNAASLRSTGLRICQSIREKDPKLPIILIVEEDKDVIRMPRTQYYSCPLPYKNLSTASNRCCPATAKMFACRSHPARP